MAPIYCCFVLGLLATIGSSARLDFRGLSGTFAPTPPPPPSFGNPGDCAVVGFKGDNPDDVAIVLLAPVPAGDKIFVTDEGVEQHGGLRSSDSEGVRSFFASETIAAGTVLRLADFSHEGGSFDLSTSGDQIIVFVGSMDSPTYVCAFSTAGSWHTSATSAKNSALPTGLTDRVNALVVSEVRNAAFAGLSEGSPDELRAAIHDFANWETSNSVPPAMPSTFVVHESSEEAQTTTHDYESDYRPSP